MSQKKLTLLAVLIPTLFFTILLVTFGDFGKMVANFIASIVLFICLFVLPVVVSYYVLSWLIQKIDALSVPKQKKGADNDSDFMGRENNRDREYFPKPVRFLIWSTIGTALALFWTWLVPHLLVYPTYLGLAARDLGWKDLGSTDNIWQHGWLIMFLIEYALALMVQGFTYKGE